MTYTVSSFEHALSDTRKKTTTTTKKKKKQQKKKQKNKTKKNNKQTKNKKTATRKTKRKKYKTLTMLCIHLLKPLQVSEMDLSMSEVGQIHCCKDRF